tara:strand:+ start:57491 stop:57844 length:354 start_codon:yes stop_codon:yes gene_type:complete
MFKSTQITLLAIFFLGAIAACSPTQFYHENLMIGQIVNVEEGEIVVCVGNSDVVELGSVLAVSRVRYDGAIIEGRNNYSLEPVGSVRVDSLIDEHFARGTVIEGDIRKNNIVQLSTH